MIGSIGLPGHDRSPPSPKRKRDRDGGYALVTSLGNLLLSLDPGRDCARLGLRNQNQRPKRGSSAVVAQALDRGGGICSVWRASTYAGRAARSLERDAKAGDYRLATLVERTGLKSALSDVADSPVLLNRSRQTAARSQKRSLAAPRPITVVRCGANPSRHRTIVAVTH